MGTLAKRALCIVLLLFCLYGTVGTTDAGSYDDTAVLTPTARDAVDTGAQLERQRLWLEAIEHYEEALEESPDSKELKYGLRRSKIHFNIERRYEDASFQARLLSQSKYEGLSLLDDVMAQVRSNYVDTISTTSLIAHGTESLYLALANEKFVDHNLRNARPEQISEFRKILRERYWNAPMSDRVAARQSVSQICDTAQSLLGLSSTPVVMEYVFGCCNALDDYSGYLTPDKLEDLYGNIDGEFVGIGIEMKAETGKGLFLVNILPESPAAEGGMQRGEYIVRIGEVDCREMTTDEAARLLRGPTGSQVRLTLQSDSSETREGMFVRRPVQVKSIPVAKMVDQQAGVGYIQMGGFQKTSAEELDAALAKLSRSGMRALIWDLRGNPGGLLTAAVEVLDRFIADGVLVSTKGRTYDQNWTYSAHRNGTMSVPLVLLVDDNSASASEIVAGAIRDHRRGTIVGRKTYGKWSVQTIFSIRGATGLRLTTAKFYSPRGSNYAKVGVEPDITVPKPESETVYFRDSDVDMASDPDLERGLQVLRTQLSQR